MVDIFNETVRTNPPNGGGSFAQRDQTHNNLPRSKIQQNLFTMMIW